MEFDEADALNQAIRLLSLRHRARITALEETVVDLPRSDVEQLTGVLTALAQNVDSRHRRAESDQ